MSLHPRYMSGLAARLLAAASLSIAFTASAQPRDGWIDVHFHLVAEKGSREGFEEAARAALQIMEADGIRTILVMSPPRPSGGADFESFAEIVKKHAPRIAMLGGGSTLNPMLYEATKSADVSDEVRRRFEETAERIIASGAKGFGEITAHHVSMSPSHPYEWMPPDHPLFLLLADIAARHDVPIDFHFDPVPADVATPSGLSGGNNPPVLRENVAGFERLLAHNRKAKIVWAHAGSDPVGFFTPQLVRRLLGSHANLSLSIRPLAPFPGSMLNPKVGVNRDWIMLLREYPDRFVLGSDSFVAPGGFRASEAVQMFAQRARMQRSGIRKLISMLPADVARRIAHENAERLYKLD